MIELVQIHLLLINNVKLYRLTKTRVALQEAVKALNHWNNSI